MQRPYHLVVQEDNFGLPAAHIEADFHLPMRYGETLRIHVRVIKLGNTSVVFRYEFMDEDRRNMLAIIEVTTVSVDMKTLRPRTLPEHFRSKMQASCVE